jgi:hypothetical protein
MRALSLSLVLLAAGCASKHFPEESNGAQHAIDRAEDAGADKHSRAMIDSARATNERAKKAEAEAINDRKVADEALRDAEKRFVRSNRRLEQVRDLRVRQEDEHRAQERALERLRERDNELHAKGVSEEDVRKLLEPQVALTRTRIQSIEATQASLEKEAELSDLEHKDAQLTVAAAKARLETADRRLEVSRALFDRAAVQAKLAEKESLDARRLELHSRVTEM